MAGDWTPITEATPRKPEIIKIASITKLDRHTVLGWMVEFWLWAQQQTKSRRIEISIAEIEQILGTPKDFMKAVCQVAWLEDHGTYVIVPRADQWLSRGAKSRLNDRLRQQRLRARNKSRSERDKNVTNVTVDCDMSRLTEQNRTEEKSIGGKPPNTPAPPDHEKFQDVVFPPQLETPEFRDAWRDWVRHRREIRHPLKSMQIAQQLRNFSALSVEESMKQIRRSIANGWRGLFSESGDKNGHSKPANHPDERRAERASREHPEQLAL